MTPIRGYEKVVCACCFLFLFVNIGFPSTSFNVYQPYVVAVPGIGDTGGSLVLTTRTLVSLIAMFLVGKWYKLLDCRVGVFVATLFTAAGFVVFGFADNLPTFCAGSLLAGVGYGMGGMVAMTMLVGRWFKSKVGTAVGIAAMGSGVAAIVMPMTATWIIHSFGLSTSFWFQAAIALTVGVVVVLLLRNRPSDLGMEPYVSEADRNPADAAHPKVHVGAIKPLSKRAHGAMFAAMVCMGCAAVGGMTYLAILMTSSGFEPYFVATVLTIGGVALTVSKGVTGMVFDAVGTRRGSAIFFALFIAGTVLCCFAGTQNHVLMFVGALLYFTGSALATVGVSVWSLDLSTPAERPKLVKDLQIAYALGSLIFCFLPGPLMDLTGTYAVSYVILSVLSVTSCVVVLGIYVRKGPSTAGRRR